MLDAHWAICNHLIDPCAIYVSRNAFMVANAPQPARASCCGEGAGEIFFI
jgi:hypothetical protein